MNRIVRIEGQRFMVSPCGQMSDWFDVSEIADECAGWTDVTELSDIELQQFIERRLQAADQAKRESRDEDQAERRAWYREYDLIHT